MTSTVEGPALIRTEPALADSPAPEAVVSTVARTPGKKRRGAAGDRTGLLATIERRVGVTPLGLGLLASAITIGIVSHAIANRGMALFAYGLGLVLIVAYALGRRNLPIEADRSTLPSRVPAKRVVDVTLSLTSGRRISSVVIEEGLDEALGLPVRIAVPVLPSGQPVNHGYSFTAGRRGVFSVGPMIAEFSDPFGLTTRRQEIAPRQTMIVHPRVERVMDRVSSREWEDPPIRPPRSRPWPTGFEFYGMREYQQGDDPRRIVWRALAQYDTYMVRESEQGITDRINLYLDSDAEFHTKGVPSDSFEAAVNIAASLGVQHIKDGFSVCLDVNSTRLIKNFRGQGKRIPLLDELAGVAIERAPLSSALDRLFSDPQRNAHNVLITPHLTQAAASRLRVHLDRGGALVLVLVVTDDTDPITLHRAGGLRCSVVEATPGASLQGVFQHVMSATRR